MNLSDDDRLARAFQITRDALLSQREPAGHWTGELSTSALSTATAVAALAILRTRKQHADFSRLIDGGAAWLVAHQNDDGGWGDTDLSISNISTSMLVRAALQLVGVAAVPTSTIEKLERYLNAHCGTTTAARAEAIRRRYGKDRTFAVPILTTSALAGLMPWSEVTPLPFELACFPQSWFRILGLPVVSYALPALIAIGQAVHQHRRSLNPWNWTVRPLAAAKSLRVLEKIQPSSGGYLEAIPLTSFVTLSLASIDRADHPVARKGLEFIIASVRPDGSWPIDSNLATWVTTLSIQALETAGELDTIDRRAELHAWLTQQQFSDWHPFTGAQPGGFGWTPLPGSLPDADDTPGAVLALCHLERLAGSPVWNGKAAARDWILALQNRDGGWPTFCRGFGNLPFDRSGTDLTAHNLRALLHLNIAKSDPSIRRGFEYLAREQRADGSWLPLWFGNQHAPDDINPTYGTARVLAAYRDFDLTQTAPARRGIEWLLSIQNPDGGWGGAMGTPSSVEETALATESLLDMPGARPSADRGVHWLVREVEADRFRQTAPIGFYFAKLWYFERLYPIIFTVAALGRALRQKTHPHPTAAPSHQSL